MEGTECTVLIRSLVLHALVLGIMAEEGLATFSEGGGSVLLLYSWP